MVKTKSSNRFIQSTQSNPNQIVNSNFERRNKSKTNIFVSTIPSLSIEIFEAFSNFNFVCRRSKHFVFSKFKFRFYFFCGDMVVDIKYFLYIVECKPYMIKLNLNNFISPCIPQSITIYMSKINHTYFHNLLDNTFTKHMCTMYRF